MELKYLDEYGLLKQPAEALVEYILQLRSVPKPEPESELRARIEELEQQNEELEDDLSSLRSERDELEEQLELENLLAKEKSKLDKLSYLSSQYDKEVGPDLSKALELAVRLLESELNKRTQPNLFEP